MRLRLDPRLPRALGSHQMKPLCLTIVACVAIVGCGGKKRVHTPAAARIGATQTGIASWYGYPYHGRRAANGEIYDMEKMTAAHRTLPFGTWVRVHNLDSGKIVEVRITDRGPFIRGRIIDLSHAAAGAVDMVGPGTAKVKITVIAAPVVVATTAVRNPIAWPAAASVRPPVAAPVPPAIVPPPATPTPAAPPIATQPITAPPAPIPPVVTAPAPAQFAVQVGAYADRATAERIRAAMEARYGRARLVLRDGRPPIWRVLVGQVATEETADALAEQIRADGQAPPNGCFVVRLDDTPASNRL